MKILKETLRRYRAAIAVYLAVTAANAAVFILYRIMTEPLLYAALFGAVLLLGLVTAGFFREKKRAAARARTLEAITSEWRTPPQAHSLAEADYREMLFALGAETEALSSRAAAERQETLDYYTAWVHQIKTPVAVMKLTLAEDTPEHRALSAELARIERYVDMALQYLRLGSGSNDLVIREYPLDELIRESIRKHAPQFVEKRLALNYAGTEAKVATDRKWFSCILDQLFSNAVKYTAAGSVTVTFENGLLTVADTGAGIAPEDLPRIFEMGYTGLNGRAGQNSSGLGLYLAKKAADLLSIELRAESTPGRGSAFTLDLRQAP